MRKLGVALGLCVTLFQAGVAEAGTVTLIPFQRLVYTAAPAEANRLYLLWMQGGFHVIDVTAPVTAGAGCTQTNANEAFCKSGESAAPRIRVDLGDMDDWVLIQALDLPGAHEYEGARLEGGDGADTLQGGSGTARNLLDGGAGPDVFVTSCFCDTGRTVIDYSKRTKPVSITTNDGLANDGEAGEGDSVSGNAIVWGGSGNDSMTGRNAVFFGGDGDDHLTNTAASGSLLNGGNGNDVLRNRAARFGTLRGEDGFDVLVGGDGSDRLFGGNGPDSLRARDGMRDVVNGEAGHDRARIDRRLDHVKSIEEFF